MLGGLSGSSDSVSGPVGTALDFDGIDDYITIPSGFAMTNTNTVTITAWIYARSKGAAEGIFYTRGDSLAGLNLSYANSGRDVGYHWKGDSNTWLWASGLQVPLNEWVFVAVAIEPTKGTVYLGGSGVLTSAVNTHTHALSTATNWRIGDDPGASGRHFDGYIDDVRFYDSTLSQSQIEDIFNAGSPP